MTESLKQVQRQGAVDAFKECMDAVREKCAAMSEESLVSLTKKRVYQEGEFQQARETRLRRLRTFGDLRAEMEDVLKKTFRAILARDSEVRRQWLNL